MRVLNLGDENFHLPPTKVGVAQPQRRTYSLAGQVLGENSVASQHKRFSLGIEKSTCANTESISQRVSGQNTPYLKQNTVELPLNGHLWGTGNGGWPLNRNLSLVSIIFSETS